MVEQENHRGSVAVDFKEEGSRWEMRRGHTVPRRREMGNFAEIKIIFIALPSLPLCAGDWPGSAWSQFLAGEDGGRDQLDQHQQHQDHSSLLCHHYQTRVEEGRRRQQYLERRYPHLEG